MKWLDTLRLAVAEIRRNLLRSVLTVTGVWIGVAAVIVLVTLGNGATIRVTGDVANLGSNLLTVRPGQDQRRPGGVSVAATSFDAADVTAVEKVLGDSAAVCPMSSRPAQAIFRGRNHSTTVTGTEARFHDVRSWPIADGRTFDPSEQRSGAAVCVLGETARRELFGGQRAVGESLRLGRAAFRVVGVLEAKGQLTFGQDQDDLILIPLRTFHRRFAGDRDVAMMFVSVREGDSTERAQARIEEVLRSRRVTSPGDEDDFSVLDMKEIMSTVEVITGVMTALLGSVAAVSLLVGGIGIMNILLVSVTERTREIGLRLAVGATEKEILTQFLLEAITLCVFGGIVGAILGLAGGAVGARALEVPFVVEPQIVALAMVFAILVGAVFGFMPARRAARLDPIRALRHE
ncbi:MAG: ABC transporter permease [Planctomycetota bacterium]